MTIRKFKGKGNAFIKAFTGTNINDVAYAPGDVVTYFQDITIEMGYQSNNKEATTDKGLLLNSTERFPYFLRLSGVRNNSNLHKILYQDPVESSSEFIDIESYDKVEGTIYLTTDKSLSKVKTFSDGVEIFPIFDADNATLMFDKKYNNVEILKFYVLKTDERGIEKPNFGYFTVTAIVEGKIGEEIGKFKLEIKKANLVTDPSFDVSDDPNFTTELIFGIITDGRAEVKLIYGKDD